MHVAGRVRNGHTILIETPEGKRSLWRSIYGWKDIMDLKWFSGQLEIVSF
jgi:hypothetical protein